VLARKIRYYRRLKNVRTSPKVAVRKKRGLVSNKAIVVVLGMGIIGYLIWKNNKPVEAKGDDMIEEELRRIRELEEDKVAFDTKSIKRTVTTEVMELPISPPWVSGSMINDGPGDVYIGTNEDGAHDLLDQVPVKDGETININMGSPTIWKIWLQSASSSSVRIHGKVGKANY